MCYILSIFIPLFHSHPFFPTIPLPLSCLFYDLIGVSCISMGQGVPSYGALMSPCCALLLGSTTAVQNRPLSFVIAFHPVFWSRSFLLPTPIL